MNVKWHCVQYLALSGKHNIIIAQCDREVMVEDASVAMCDMTNHLFQAGWRST
jgi:hypothetical protein